MPAGPPEVVIRRATTADIEDLAGVGSESFREAYGPHSGAADIEAHIAANFSPAAIREGFAGGLSDFYIASASGEAAGMARVRLAGCPLPGGDANALELQQLYVLARLRRHGLGRLLVEHAIAHARQAGAAGVWLSAWEFADWAVQFYKDVGFAPIGKVDFKLGSAVYTDLLMWRPL